MHQKKPHDDLIVALAFPLLLGVLGIVPESTRLFGTFLVLTLISALIYIFHVSEAPFRRRIMIGLFLTVISIATFCYVDNRNYQIEISATDHFVLTPGNEESPEDRCTRQAPEGTLRVFWGDSHEEWADEFPSTLLRTVDRPILIIGRNEKTKEITIKTFELFDDRGTAIVTINDGDGDGHIDTTAQRIPIDRHTIRVRDHNNDVVLNMRYLNPTALYITGIFRGTRGELFDVTKERIQINGGSEHGGMDGFAGCVMGLGSAGAGIVIMPSLSWIKSH